MIEQKLLYLRYRFPRMKMQQYIPATALRPFVKNFMVIESGAAMTNRILPGTMHVMAFRLKGMVSDGGPGQTIPCSAFSGLRRSHRVLHYEKNTATLLVQFKEGGAAPFFKTPLHETYGLSISLDNLFPRQLIAPIEDRLQHARTHEQCVAIVEEFLISRLPAIKTDPLISHAIHLIQSSHGTAKIKDLAGELHISIDPFEKRFRKITGSTPKQFAGIVRLRNLIDHFPKNKNLTDAAYSAGYFDQAHFIKDFRLFTGQAPQHFFADNKWW
jgi:AraC-like DNA-binding protein